MTASASQRERALAAPHPRLQKWVIVQAVVWLPSLIASAWLLHREDARAITIGATAGIIVSSYAWLWLALGAGRRVADWVTLLRFARCVL